MGSYLNNSIKLGLIVFGLALSLAINSSSFAEAKSLTINLKTARHQSFASFMKQAELAAINSIKNQFNQLSTVTEVKVTVIGERNGQAVPLLFTRVSRVDWQAQPRIQFWTKYFTKASTLLGFNLPQKAQTTPGKSPSNFSLKESDSGFRDD